MEMDANDDGKLTKDELPERAQQFIQRADTNQDGEVTKDEIQAFVQLLSKYVTRHEKSQMINGQQIMKLPEKVYKVVQLQMSPEETNRYKACLGSLNKTRIRNFERSGAQFFPLEQGLIHPLSGDKLLSDSWKESTKLSALYREIQQLWKKDPNLRTVIFTQN